MTLDASPALQPRLSFLSQTGEPEPDERLSAVAAAALRFSESLDLPVVLGQVAEQAAALFDGVCQVRFTPPRRPADARRAVAGAGLTPRVNDRAGGDEPYAALLARLAGRASAAWGEAGAALMVAPLVARGKRIGTLDVVIAAPDEPSLIGSQRLLHTLARHAALAIDNADRIARPQPASAPSVAGGESLNQLLSMVAHDLRNPLAALSSSVQLLVRMSSAAQSLSAERVLHLAEVAQSAVAQLETQIGGLTPGAPGGPLSVEGPAAPVDLVRLVRLTAHFYQQTTSRHQIAVCAEVPELAGPWSRSQVDRVLGNLLTNAIKYSPAGGAIRVALGRQDDETGGWCTLSVQNHGIGIPPQDLPQLARPGFRARNVGAIPGTGFGLASVREVVEQCGGTLAVQSGLGEVTTVLVRLPLA